MPGGGASFGFEVDHLGAVDEAIDQRRDTGGVRQHFAPTGRLAQLEDSVLPGRGGPSGLDGKGARSFPVTTPKKRWTVTCALQGRPRSFRRANPKSPLLLHDPSLTTSAESNDDPDDDPTPPGGPRGRSADVQSSGPMYDSRTIGSASAELTARGVPQPGRGPALGAGCWRFKSSHPDRKEASGRLVRKPV